MLKQLSFLPKIQLSHSSAHGGDLRKGKRKTARPFDPKRPIHLVLRSTRAKGSWSMLRHSREIQILLDAIAKKFGIRVHRFANVGNHLHLLISIGPSEKNSGGLSLGQTRFVLTRNRFSSFLRQFAGAVACQVTGASKSNSVGGFWDATAFTRVLHWGREFDAVMIYLVKNLFEAAGLWNRKKHPDWKLGWGAT